MTWQLREYAIKPGEMEAGIDEWRRHVVPLRRKYGFEVVGAWKVQGTNRFVWILRYDGPKPWREADADYYGSPERTAINPDPARHLAETKARLMDEVPAG
jgi:hypothetical protein